MDKRSGLRQHFQNEANKASSDIQYSNRTQQINDFESTVVDGFTALIRFLDGKTTKTEVINQLKSISTPDVDKVVTAISKLDADILANKLDLTPLKQGLDSLKRELSLIPKSLPKIPEQKDNIKVNNLDEVKLDTAKLEKAILGLKLDPQINVKASDVQIDYPDLKPLQDALKDVVSAVKNQKYPTFPDIPKTDLTKVEKKLDESNKHLKKLVDKPVGGGGGGGGNGTPYVDSTGKPVNVEVEADGSIPVTVADPTLNYSLVQFDDTSSVSYEYYAYMDKDSNWYIKRLTTATNLFEFTAPVATTYSTGWTNRASLTYLAKGSAF